MVIVFHVLEILHLHLVAGCYSSIGREKKKRNMLYFVRCGQYNSVLWSEVCCNVNGGVCSDV
jgi:hypothetical protein